MAKADGRKRSVQEGDSEARNHDAVGRAARTSITRSKVDSGNSQEGSPKRSEHAETLLRSAAFPAPDGRC